MKLTLPHQQNSIHHENGNRVRICDCGEDTFLGVIQKHVVLNISRDRNNNRGRDPHRPNNNNKVLAESKTNWNVSELLGAFGHGVRPLLLITSLAPDQNSIS